MRRLIPALLLPSLLLACGDKDAGDTGGDTSPVDADGDGYDAEEDCDDADPAVNPGADEVCDGVDNDCSGAADDGAVDAPTWYGDADGDGHGAADQSVVACEAGPDQVDNGDDCDDADPAVNPGADEVCDGVDNDCSGAIDDDAIDMATFYADADGDGFGDAADTADACEAPSGFVTDDTDCDDTRADVAPGADEVCDGADNDCDGQVDAGLRVPADHATIQAALDAATAGDQVCIADGTYNETLDVGVDVALVGAGGSGSVIVDAQGAGSVLTADDATTLVLRGLTLQGGDAVSGAGLYLLGGVATLEDVQVSGNIATGGYDAGAGIYAETNTLTLTDSVVSDNHATGEGVRGAGVFAIDSVVFVDGTELRDNSVTGRDAAGGGLYASGGTLEVVDSVVSGNSLLGTIDDTSNPDGAGIAVNDTEVRLQDTTVQDNHIDQTTTGYAYASGAGVSLVSEDIELERVSLLDNSIDLSSGEFLYIEGVGLYTEGWNDEGGTTTLTDVEVRDNDAMGTSADRFAIIYGGGVTLYGDNDNVVDGLHITGTTGTVDDSTGSNSGFIAGLALEAFEGTLAGARLDIRDNTGSTTATGFGGLVSLEWTATDLHNVVLANNTLAADGDVNGGLVVLIWDPYGWYTRQHGADAFFTNVDIVGNQVSGDTVTGGLITADGAGLVSLVNANVVGNTATGTTAVQGGVGFQDTEDGGALSTSYVNVHDNAGGTGAFEDASGALTVSTLDLDPAYTDVSPTDAVDWDLSLSAGSSAIDAGDPGILDADGSTSDLGAHGGPGGDGW